MWPALFHRYKCPLLAESGHFDIVLKIPQQQLESSVNE